MEPNQTIEKLEYIIALIKSGQPAVIIVDAMLPFGEPTRAIYSRSASAETIRDLIDKHCECLKKMEMSI